MNNIPPIYISLGCCAAFVCHCLAYANADTSLLFSFSDPTVTNADEFGSSVAISGTRILVGARRDDSKGGDVGQAYLLDIKHKTVLNTFNDPVLTFTDHPLFGHAVALQGNYALVGAPNDSSGPGTGLVYLFDATTGGLIHEFVDPTVTQFDQFGWSLALDDDHILVGDRGDDTLGSHIGQAHLFDAVSGAPLQTLNDPTPQGSDNFGWSVAIKGNYAIVGAPSDSTAGPGIGQAHLFDVTTGNLLHTFDDPTPTDVDGFGYAVAISDQRLLISARGDDTLGSNVGQVHLYDLTTFDLLHTMDDPTAQGEDNFGFSLALQGDRILIGENSDGANGHGFGQVHLFDAITGSLVETINSPILSSEDGFGTRVSLDGSKFLVGAIADDIDGTDVGRVYLFEIPEPSSLVFGSLLLAISAFARVTRRGRQHTGKCYSMNQI